MSTSINASLGISTVPNWRMRFLPSFCFSNSFFFARDVAAVALGQHVLAHGFHRLAGDDLAADGRLDRDLELLARDDLLEPLGIILPRV